MAPRQSAYQGVDIFAQEIMGTTARAQNGDNSKGPNSTCGKVLTTKTSESVGQLCKRRQALIVCCERMREAISGAQSHRVVEENDSSVFIPNP
jgi:hypothetical protein